MKLVRYEAAHFLPYSYLPRPNAKVINSSLIILLPEKMGGHSSEILPVAI